MRGNVGPEIHHPPALRGGDHRGRQDAELVAFTAQGAGNRGRRPVRRPLLRQGRAQEGAEGRAGQVLVVRFQIAGRPAAADPLHHRGNERFRYRDMSGVGDGAAQNVGELPGIQTLDRLLAGAYLSLQGLRHRAAPGLLQQHDDLRIGERRQLAD